MAWQVAHELARVGEEITVVARETAGESAVPVKHVRVPTFWQPLRVRAFDRAATRATTRTGATPFDVVHSFSRTRNQDLYRAGGGSHSDYLRSRHGSVGRFARLGSPRHRILLEIERCVFRKSEQRIQCSSRLVADALVSVEGVAQSRIFLLPNGVDTHRYGAQRCREAGLRMRALADLHQSSGPLWLFPGSGWHRKGLDRLLAALTREALRNHRLWIVGRDDARPWKRRAARLGIANRLHFLGDRRDLEVLYQAVDAMVLPTRYDPFANVTLEAAAAGLPIVTSSSNGAAEWLGSDVRIVDEMDDADQLACALAEFESPQQRSRVGRSLSLRASHFGWDRHVEQLRDEYKRLARGPGKASTT